MRFSGYTGMHAGCLHLHLQMHKSVPWVQKSDWNKVEHCVMRWQALLVSYGCCSQPATAHCCTDRCLNRTPNSKNHSQNMETKEAAPCL